MAFIDILKLIKFDELTDKERDEWKKRFQDHKKYLNRAMKAVDQGLVALAKPKPKRKKKS